MAAKVTVRWGIRRLDSGLWQPWVDLGCNVMLLDGLEEMLDLIFGLGTPTAFDETNIQLGVGDDGTEAEWEQHDLISPLDWVSPDPGTLTRTDNVVSIRGTFGAGVGTGTWREAALDNRALAGTKVMCRKVLDPEIVKGAGEVKQLQASMVIT